MEQCKTEVPEQREIEPATSWSATCTTRSNGQEGKTLGGRRRPHHSGHVPGEAPVAVRQSAGSAYQREEQPEEREEAKKSPPWVDDSLSKQDRHAFFFGTMKASLLICAAYLVGFGVFILILTLLVPLTAERSDPKRGILQPEDAPFYTHYRKMGGLL